MTEPVPVCERCGRRHERDGLPTCRAHRAGRDKGPCRQWPVVGLAVCRTHGGQGKHVERKVANARLHRHATGAVAKLLNECDLPSTHPLDGLLEVVRHAGAMTRLLSGLVGDLEVHPEDGTETISMNEEGEVRYTRPKSLYGPNHLGDGAPNVLVELYGIWSDRYAKACKLALDANIDERLVRNAESTSIVLFEALGRALDAADLTEVQRAKISGELATELRRHAGVES